MFSILLADGKSIKKAKGTTKAVTKKELRHQSYLDALFKQKTFWHGMDMLRSEAYTSYGMHVNKVSLSPFDSKRWIFDDGVHTLAYGHKDINRQCWRVIAHDEQLVTNKSTPGPIIQVVKNGHVRLGDNFLMFSLISGLE